MMNDRFSADLRRHLLATANERPADGQLAALAGHVAVTPQRRPLVARLTWNPGRIGPFPTKAIRYGLIAIALALAAVAGAILAGTTRSGPSTVFEGTWIAIDPADGSGMTLVVGAGKTPAVYFEDGYASGDACLNDVVRRFTARGNGAIAGIRLDVAWPDGGGCGLVTVPIGDGSYAYDEQTNTLVDGQDLTWTRALGRDQQATQAPASDVPASAQPSPGLGKTTYKSAMHGISIEYPSGWQTRPATESWTGSELSFDSPAADVIYDPTLGDRVYLVLASQPYGDLGQDAWRDGVLAWTCLGDEHEMWGWRVDGAYAYQQGPCNSGSLIFTEDRGYLIRLVVASDEPGLADMYNWDWLVPVLETVDLRADEAVDGRSPSASGCIQFDDGGTYTAPVGELSVTVTVPVAAEKTWSGLRDSFNLERAPCGSSGVARLHASVVSQVYADACNRAGTGVEVKTAAEAAEAMAAQTGLEVLLADDEMTVGGYPARRLFISLGIDFDATKCGDGGLRFWRTSQDAGASVAPGWNTTFFLVDVDGSVLALSASRLAGDAEEVPLVEELHSMVASLRIEP